MYIVTAFGGVAMRTDVFMDGLDCTYEIWLTKHDRVAEPRIPAPSSLTDLNSVMFVKSAQTIISIYLIAYNSAFQLRCAFSIPSTLTESLHDCHCETERYRFSSYRD